MTGATALSSRGLGRRPLTAVTRVRIPLGLPRKPRYGAVFRHLSFVVLPIVYLIRRRDARRARARTWQEDRAASLPSGAQCAGGGCCRVLRAKSASRFHPCVFAARWEHHVGRLLRGVAERAVRGALLFTQRLASMRSLRQRPRAAGCRRRAERSARRSLVPRRLRAQSAPHSRRLVRPSPRR